MDVKSKTPPKLRTETFNTVEKFTKFVITPVSPTIFLSKSETVNPAVKKKSEKTPNSFTDLKLMGSSKEEVDP